jgi:hypothetical protein
MTVNEGAKIHHLIGMRKWFICRKADIDCLLFLFNALKCANVLMFKKMIYSQAVVKKSKKSSSGFTVCIKLPTSQGGN